MNKLESAKKALKEYWGWNEYYWFPLVPTTRSDLIAFDCRKLEKNLPEEDFEKFLEGFFNGNDVYVFPEHDEAHIELCSEYGYWFSELCIAEENLRNVVYWSHEGTVTLGGIKLIEKFKASFPNYKDLICELGEKL